MDCICTFPSVYALKIHLTQKQTSTVVLKESQAGCAAYICPNCGFKEMLNEKSLLGHLRSHLKKHETLECPFKNCRYKTNAYSSFKAHKSRSHSNWDVTGFKNDIVQKETDSQSIQGDDESNESDPFQQCA